MGSMTALELIDQILGRTPFKCTEPQLRFLRDLVVQGLDPEAKKKSDEIHKKKVLAALRRNLTHAKKEFEAAKKELSDAEELGV